MTEQVHPVDEILPPARLGALGLQHVLVMYAGAIAVPLIIAGALGLNAEQRALLINADLLACGLATLVQAIGFPGVGIRLPVMMGVTFASVAPMMAMITAAKAGGNFVPTNALLTIYGAVIAAGVRPSRRTADRAGAALLPAGGHRHDHHGDRPVAHAHRRRLGRGALRQPDA